MSAKINLISLDKEVTEEQIRDHFSTIGAVKSVRLMKEGGRSLGLAIVEMENPEDAREAVLKLNGSQLGSQAFMANLMKDKVPGPKALKLTHEMKRDLFSFSETWEIEPGVGVGPLKFGMTKDEIEKIWGSQPSECQDADGQILRFALKPAVLAQKIKVIHFIEDRDPDMTVKTEESFFGLSVYLNGGGKADCFHFKYPEQQLSLKGRPLVGELFFRTKKYIHDLDPAVDPTTFFHSPSEKLLIGVFSKAHDNLGSEINDLVNVVSVFSQSYFDQKYAEGPKNEKDKLLEMTSEEVWKAIEKSPAWEKRQSAIRLVFDDEVSDGHFVGTKIGGHPIQESGGKMDRCPACQKELTLLLQLETKGLAAYFAPKTPSLLQIFYCRNIECDEGGYHSDPVKSTQIRVFNPDKKCSLQEIKNPFEEHRLLLKKKFDDVENPWDEPKTKKWLKTIDQKLSQGLTDIMHAYLPSPGEKVGGFPHWIQSPDVPSCEECSKKEAAMKFILQINSHDEWGLNFGARGMIYIFQCQKHPQVFEIRCQYT